MPIDLPPPIASYFAADAADDIDTLVQLFTNDATVIDERKTHTGRAAIRAWKADATAQFDYTVEPFAIAQDDGQRIVTTKLTGNFPGSPVDLRYAFTLRDALIERLEIAP